MKANLLKLKLLSYLNILLNSKKTGITYLLLTESQAAGLVEHKTEIC